MKKESIIAVALTLTTIFSCFPFVNIPAHSAEIDVAAVMNGSVEVARYPSIQAAIDGAQNGNTIKLLTDVSMTITGKAGSQNPAITFGTEGNNTKAQNLIFDGNGHTLTATLNVGNIYTGVINVYNQSQITIKNLTLDVTNTNSATGSCGAIVSRYSTLVTLDNCDVTVTNTQNLGALFTNDSGRIVLQNGTTVIADKAKIFTIAGGGSATVGEGCTVYAPELPTAGVTNNGTFVQTAGDAVAQVGSTVYSSLSAAFAAVGDNGTVTLLKNISSSSRIDLHPVAGRSITFNGNGKTITSTADAAVMISTKVNTTVKDLKIVVNDNTSNGYGAVLQVKAGGTATIESCDFSSTQKCFTGIIAFPDANTTVNVTGETKFTSTNGNIFWTNGANSKLNVYSATLKSKYLATAASGGVGSTVTLFDGADAEYSDSYLREDSSNVNLILNGGSIKSTNSQAAAINTASGTSTVLLLKGKVSGGNAAYYNSSTQKKIEYPQNSNEKTFESPSIEQRDGASVRIFEGSSGIRFASIVSKRDIALLDEMTRNQLILDYRFGALICDSADLNSQNAFDHDTLAADQIDFNDVISSSFDENGAVISYSYLLGITAANYEKEFAAVSYIVLTLPDGSLYRIYSDFDPSKNIRSVKDVAYMALSDVKPNQDSEYTHTVDSYYQKSEFSYTKVAQSAFSPYSSSSIGLLENYINGVENYDPNISVGESEMTMTVYNNTDGTFLPLGRTYSSGNALACDFTCSGIAFNAYCRGAVYAKISTNADAYFTVFIDGIRQPTRLRVTASNSDWLEVASGLSSGKHEIRIVKQTQYSQAVCKISEIKITGKFAEKPAEKQLFLEFYGDSILNGSNIYLGGTSAVTTDATKAFPFLTGEQLGADVSVVGNGGLGISQSTTAAGGYILSDLMYLSGSPALSGTPEYGFERIPDAVILGIGVNDIVSGVSETAFKAKVDETIDMLRAKYGNDVKIVWVYGHTDNSNRVSGQETYWNYLKSAIDAMNDENLSYFRLSPACVLPSDGGDGIHPGIESSEMLAGELTAYLRQLLG